MKTSSPKPPVKVDIYKDRSGEWRWRLKSANGKIVADSGEGYFSKWTAKRAARKFLGV